MSSIFPSNLNNIDVPIKQKASYFEKFQYWLARKVVINNNWFCSKIASIFEKKLPYFKEIKGKIKVSIFSFKNRVIAPIEPKPVDPDIVLKERSMSTHPSDLMQLAPFSTTSQIPKGPPSLEQAPLAPLFSGESQPFNSQEAPGDEATATFQSANPILKPINSTLLSSTSNSTSIVPVSKPLQSVAIGTRRNLKMLAVGVMAVFAGVYFLGNNNAFDLFNRPLQAPELSDWQKSIISEISFDNLDGFSKEVGFLENLQPLQFNMTDGYQCTDDRERQKDIQSLGDELRDSIALMSANKYEIDRFMLMSSDPGLGLGGNVLWNYPMPHKLSIIPTLDILGKVERRLKIAANLPRKEYVKTQEGFEFYSQVVVFFDYLNTKTENIQNHHQHIYNSIEKFVKKFLVNTDLGSTDLGRIDLELFQMVSPEHRLPCVIIPSVEELSSIEKNASIPYTVPYTVKRKPEPVSQIPTIKSTEACLFTGLSALFQRYKNIDKVKDEDDLPFDTVIFVNPDDPENESLSNYKERHRNRKIGWLLSDLARYQGDIYTNRKAKAAGLPTEKTYPLNTLKFFKQLEGILKKQANSLSLNEHINTDSGFKFYSLVAEYFRHYDLEQDILVSEKSLHELAEVYYQIALLSSIYVKDNPQLNPEHQALIEFAVQSGHEKALTLKNANS